MPGRWMDVPPGALLVADDIAAESPKCSRQELDTIARTIPLVYEEMACGRSDADLLAMRSSRDPQERQVGETYAAVFRDQASSTPLKATLTNGRLEVQSGNHRVRAAQANNVSAVPILVQADDEPALDRVEAMLSRGMPVEVREARALQQSRQELEKDRNPGRSAERTRERR